MSYRNIESKKNKAIEGSDISRLYRLREEDERIKFAWRDYNVGIPGTLPEKMVYQYLKRLGVYFQFQYHMADKPGTSFPETIWKPDFILPDYNAIVEVYGSYWHSIPETLFKDQEKQMLMMINGYSTMYLGQEYFPSQGAYQGKFIIWWEEEIYQGVARLVARDLPEIMEMSIRRRAPASYIQDIEAEKRKKRARKGRFVAKRVVPKIVPYKIKLPKVYGKKISRKIY